MLELGQHEGRVDGVPVPDENAPGPIIVNYRDYISEVYSGPAFLVRKNELYSVALDITIRSERWSNPELAEEMVRRGAETRSRSGVNRVLSPSMILFREKDAQPGVYVGFSKQCLRRIHTSYGEIPLFHLQARAILEEHRGVGLGRLAIQQGRLLYNEAAWFAQRSASAIAFWSALGTQGLFREGSRYPWDAPYPTNFLAQEIVVGLFFQIRANGLTMDMSTGVSVADYPEGNQTDIPRLDHGPTMELRRKMQEEFGMVFPRGDSMNGVYQFR